jgi:mannose-6-phosphate isomerase-like protein (cupin superfamily)
MASDSPVRIDKPWGSELLLRNSGTYVVKVLFVNAGCRLSLQYHRVKRETLLAGCGEVAVEVHIDGKVMTHSMDTPVELPPGTVHRIVAIEDCEVVEVSSCELEDVVRLEDDYHRMS